MAAGSTTSTTLASVGLGATWAVGDDLALLASIEADRWRRGIAGTASAIGLQERYRLARLYAGAVRTGRFAAGTLAADASLFTSTPERIHVGFSGRFDPAVLGGARTHGLRLGLALRPAQAPWLELRGRFDRAAASRSGNAPLTLHGQYRGSIAQPEHVRQSVTLTVSALY